MIRKEREDRPYQNDAIHKFQLCVDDRGRLVMPPGSGKSYIEARILESRIGGCAIHLVVAPRIALINQLIKEYRDIISKDYIAFGFHSGVAEIDYTQIQHAEYSSTHLDVLDEQYTRCKNMGVDLVVFTTYKSFHRLKDILFETAIFDESQYCTTEDGFNGVKLIEADMKLFFTATEKHHKNTEHSRGLNNSDVFGDIIYKIMPKELIAQGHIVQPKLHIMRAQSDVEEESVIDEICNLANGQIDETDKMGMPFKKILFSCKGTSDVRKVIKKLDVFKKKFPTFRIFTIMSNPEYAAMIDGVKVDRSVFFDELEKDGDAFVFHYDIISEGIDVTSFTGVCILRNMDHTKLIQTVGRAQRVWSKDKDIKDLSKRVKKHAIVSVSCINGNRESESYVRDIMIRMALAGYDVTVEQILFSDNPGFGIGEEFAINPLIPTNKPGIVNDMLDTITHEFEDEAKLRIVETYTDLELIQQLQ